MKNNNKSGRPAGYTKEQLLEILLQYTKEHPDQMVRLFELEAATGIKRHVGGKVCVDHVHMYVANPPKLCVSELMSYLKGKSTLMLFDRHPEHRIKYGDRHYWERSSESYVGRQPEIMVLRNPAFGGTGNSPQREKK